MDSNFARLVLSVRKGLFRKGIMVVGILWTCVPVCTWKVSFCLEKARQFVVRAEHLVLFGVMVRTVCKIVWAQILASVLISTSYNMYSCGWGGEQQVMVQVIGLLPFVD